MSKRKKIPKFKSMAGEAEFWRKHDSTDYIDWSKAKTASFPRLKPSTKVVSIRLSESLLNELKVLANKEDIPYQTFMKILLVQGVHQHRQ